MITECFIKGRYDFGVGKCAVVIKEGDEIVHQVAWKVPQSWPYAGETIEADQYNCEILAATYALQWCTNKYTSAVNIYANTKTCQKWYMKGEFPESREAAAKMYTDAYAKYNEALNEYEGKEVAERVFADWVSKEDINEWNMLVNRLAEQVK